VPHHPRQRHPVPYYPHYPQPHYPRPHYPYPPQPPRPRRGVGRTLLWITLWIVALGAALVGSYFGTLYWLS
jgi:hypothetical protein